MIIDMSITQREVYGYGQIYFAATKNVLEEGISFLYLRVLEGEFGILTFDDPRLIPLHVVSQVLAIQYGATNNFMPAILLRNEELKFEILALITRAQIMLQQNYLVELKHHLGSRGRLCLDL